MNEILSYTEKALVALERSEQFYKMNEHWMYLFWFKAANGFLLKAEREAARGNNGKAD